MSLSYPHRRSGRTTLIILAVLAVVAAVGIWFFTRPGSQPAVVQGREVAEQFLGHLRQGHADKAWETTSAEFKSAQGKESFVRAVSNLAFLQQNLDYVSVQTVTVGNQPRSEFQYRAPSGEVVRVVLARDGNQWKVDRWTH